MSVRACIVCTLLPVLWGACADAHPLGNDTVNRAAHVTVAGGELRIEYALDLAEIPTLLAASRADVNADGKVDGAEWAREVAGMARDVVDRLALTVDGVAVTLEHTAPRWSLRDGAAGLAQLRIELTVRAALEHAGEHRIVYRDAARPADVGWREVWVGTDTGAAIVDTDAARADRSAGLTQFPAAAGSWPHETTAAMTVRVDGLARAAEAPAAAPSASRDVAPRGPGALFLLGVHHIATGWDHLVFLLGLVLLARGLRDVLCVVTAFTLAHSLTLGLAVAGLVMPPGRVIEPAIALSIAWVGWCNLRGARGHGLPLAFGFGLVHGFGFAGALAETFSDATLGGQRWFVSLAAFNLGIEAFQVLLLCLCVPLLFRLSRHACSGQVRRGAAHGVLWVGMGWFVTRIVGA